MQFQLDSQALRALSSKSRVDILKLLVHRRYMQSELSAMLNLSVPTVKEHLNALEKVGLVERHDEGRKWKYYQVTDKTKSLFNSEYYKFVITLGIFIISAGLSFIISLALLFIHNFKSGSKTSGKYLGNLIGLLFLATHT